MTTRRTGFSLVELLVSMALIVFIMSILTEAFSQATESIRLLKAQGDMANKLQTATVMLRSDLKADHFIGGGAKLSDHDMSYQSPPDWGFFRIWNGAPSTNYSPAVVSSYPREATVPATVLASSIGTEPVARLAADHALHFTRKADDGSWKQVAWYLAPTGGVADATPLYALYRREIPIATPLGGVSPPSVDLTIPYDVGGVTGNPAPPFGNYTTRFGVSSNKATGGAPLVSRSVAAGAAYNNYPTLSEIAGGPHPYDGDDVVLTDVVSMEILLLTPQAHNGQQLVNLFDGNLNSFRSGNPAFYRPSAAAAPTGAGVFDTWSKSTHTAATPLYDYGNNWYKLNTVESLPLKIRVTALQISLRIWDNRTKQTRQLSIFQDM